MEANQRHEALHIPEGSGKRLWVIDELMTLKAPGEDTSGAYSLIGSVVPPGGVPPSTSTTGRRGFLGSRGEPEVQVGEKIFGAEAGSFIHLPKGIVHTYESNGTEPTRFLTLVVPAGLEMFF